jgi:DNA repair photolyase
MYVHDMFFLVYTPPMPTDIAPTLANNAHPAERRRGRGAVSNPTGRFEERNRVGRDDDWSFEDELPVEDPHPPLRTVVTDETCRTIIARNTSPDVPFEQSINPYRGCEHGCIYCYARPTHAYHGLSSGLDFESRLFAKPGAVSALERELSGPSYRCRVIALGTNTDCYQPVERDRRITRGILELLARCDHPVAIVTKSHLVTRDLDLLAPMAERRLAQVMVSVTTLDPKLARQLEPRAATPARRLDTIAALAHAGIPVSVLVSPIIPGLTDSELESILAAAHAAGARSANWILVRLPHDVGILFREWLASNVPGRASRVMALIREARRGRDNDPAFGTRMRGSGPFADLLSRRFAVATRKLGLNVRSLALDCTRFRPPVPAGGQIPLL